MPVNVGQAAVDAVVAKGEPFVVDAHQVQDGGVQIVTVGPALDGLVAELIALAVADAPLDAGAGQPGDERAAVVVAAGRRPGVNGIRPNSVVQISSVSSSRPRCLRSVNSAAIGRSTLRAMAGSSLWMSS